MDNDVKVRFKRLMSAMESSGGKFTDHKQMTKGMHSGSKAQGEFGLMPLTAKEVATRRKAQGIADDMDRRIAAMTDEEAKESVPVLLATRPDKYEAYVDSLMEHVLNKQGGDIRSAAVAWHDGHNRSKESIKKLVDSGTRDAYLRRVDRLLGSQSPEPVKQKIAEKAFVTTKGVMETNPKESGYVQTSPFMRLTEVPDYSQELLNPEEIKYRRVRNLITSQEPGEENE